VSLSRQILLALVSGVVVGLFFGDKVAFLDVGGRAFVQLLQITVLPYVAGSLVAGFGSMRREDARLMASRGGLLLLALWALSLGLVFLLPLALPAGKGGAFFSFAGLEAERSIDWLDLYIPANPFRSLANNVVPAVVVFAVLAGVGLMALPRKQVLLEPLAVFNEAMARVGSLLARLTPFGIFAISGHTAGTMQLEEFERLQGFVLTYAVFACLLTFWLLPGLVSALTPVSHRRMIALAQDALVTAFVTSNLFIVLPILVERSRTLLSERRAKDGANDGERENELVDVLVPTSFNFPHGAKVLSIGFVLFAGWYAGVEIPAARYPALAGAGLLSVFGSINTAIPFLLDLMRVPADLFQLFVVSGVLNSRFGAMTSAMHTLVVAVLGTCLVTGRIELRRAHLARYLVVSALLVAAAVLGTRALLERILPEPAKAAELLGGLAPRPPLAPVTLLRTPPPPPEPPTPRGERLAAILESGRLRVGFSDDSVPWVYVNAKDEVVGFDAEMAHSLALQLGVRLEFVLLPQDRERIVEALDSGVVDVIMSGTRASTRNAARVAYSQPYAAEAVAFLVEDYRREEFATIAGLRGRRLRIGAAPVPEWLEALKRALPDADVVPVMSIREFVEKRIPLDAMLTSWERACAWSLLYPAFAPVATEPRPGLTALAYVLPRDEPELLRVVDTWIGVTRGYGRFDSARQYWILGQATRQKKPRWSVARNVLGWGKD
jgi:Na+/H+-dicarboxylate symporter/ABC-type amino acid transport substrate-binding protein